MKKLCTSVLLALALTLNSIPAFAITQPGNANTPVQVSTEAMDFSVTVPTTLPVTVSSDGTISVANNAEIVNDSYGPVKITSINVTPSEGWNLIDFDTTADSLSMNSKKLGLKLFNNKVNTDGTVALTGLSAINGGESLKLPYEAVVNSFSKAFTGSPASITITIGWDEAKITGYEVKPPKVDISELNPEDYGVDYIVEVGSQFYMTGVSTYSVEDELSGITWTSSDESIATVESESGLVTVLNAGYFDITGHVPGLEEPVTVKYGVPDQESGEIPSDEIQARTDCLTFAEENGNDFTLQISSKVWNGKLEYSMDGNTWTEYSDTSTIINSVNGKLYLRGSNTTYMGTPNSTSQKINILPNTARIKCIGNIETLLDWQKVVDGKHPVMQGSCFAGLFSDCKTLIQAPELPATTLTTGCYKYMFYGCSSLTQAPELPATTLANNCYQYMFQNCFKLTQAPELPATTLTEYCYQRMFQNCRLLTQAPELPATTLAKNCYDSMFFSCTSLIQAPALPATTITNECYSMMFYGCTSLTQIPKLPAKVIALGSYSNMFNNCTSIKLSENKTGEYQIPYRIPTEGTGTTTGTTTGLMSNMFTGTGGTFVGQPKINRTYYLSTSNSIVE